MPTLRRLPISSRIGSKSGETPVYELFEYDSISVARSCQTHPDNTFLHWSYGTNAKQTWVTAFDELDHA